MKEHKRQKDINESHSKKNEDKQREAPRDTKQPPGDLKCFEATQPPNQKKQNKNGEHKQMQNSYKEIENTLTLFKIDVVLLGFRSVSGRTRRLILCPQSLKTCFNNMDRESTPNRDFTLQMVTILCKSLSELPQLFRGFQHHFTGFIIKRAWRRFSHRELRLSCLHQGEGFTFLRTKKQKNKKKNM